MRIGLITNLYPPIQTGTAHWTQELARHLGSAGHEVTVIACAVPDAEMDASDRGGAGSPQVFRLAARRLAVSRLLMGFDEFYVANTAENRRRMQSILAARGVEVLHQCGHLLDLTYATPIVARRLRVPAICSIHTVIHSPTSRALDFAMKGVDRTLVRWFGPNRYQALVALDGRVRSYIDDTYAHPRSHTVLVSIDDDVLRRPPVRPDSHPPFRILSVGHVTAMRSRMDLVGAIDCLHRSGTAVELIVVGKLCDGRAQAFVRSHGLDGVVKFTGELPRNEIFALASTCHMEAHWITVPGLGSATLEAMALGLPVLAWVTPGLYGEVPLRDGENLLVAVPGDVDQIASQINRLIVSPRLRESIGREGRTLVNQHLTWKVAVSALEQIYREVLGLEANRRFASAAL